MTQTPRPKQFHLLTLFLTMSFAGAMLPALVYVHRWAEEEVEASNGFFAIAVYVYIVFILCFGAICEKYLQKRKRRERGPE